MLRNMQVEFMNKRRGVIKPILKRLSCLRIEIVAKEICPMVQLLIAADGLASQVLEGK